MNYCKIDTSAQAMIMPNPFHIAVANPSEVQKAQLADMFGWLPMRYTTPPEYDPATQIAVSHWEERDGEAVQVWEIHDKPTPEPTLEDRVTSLEGNVSDIISGVTE